MEPEVSESCHEDNPLIASTYVLSGRGKVCFKGQLQVNSVPDSDDQQPSEAGAPSEDKQPSEADDLPEDKQPSEVGVPSEDKQPFEIDDLPEDKPPSEAGSLSEDKQRSEIPDNDADYSTDVEGRGDPATPFDADQYDLDMEPGSPGPDSDGGA